jgi:hypothetical protein
VGAGSSPAASISTWTTFRSARVERQPRRARDSDPDLGPVQASKDQQLSPLERKFSLSGWKTRNQVDGRHVLSSKAAILKGLMTPRGGDPKNASGTLGSESGVRRGRLPNRVGCETAHA